MITQANYIQQRKSLEITVILFIALLFLIGCGSKAGPDETYIQATIDAAVMETVQAQTTAAVGEAAPTALAAVATAALPTPTSIPPTATPVPPPTATPIVPTATPDLESIIPQAAPLCEAALSSSERIEDPVESPILALTGGFYQEPGEWVLSSQASPFIGATSVSDVNSIICIYEQHNKVGQYTDGTSAQVIQWDVWALSWPDGHVITSTTLYGGRPPNVKKSFGFGIGSYPFEAYREWLDQGLKIYPDGVFSHNTIVSNLKFLPDGSTLIAEGAGKVTIWDIENEELINALDASILVTLSDGKMLTVAADKWRVDLVDVETEQTLWSYDIPTDVISGPYGFILSQNGKTMAANGTSSEARSDIYLWDVETGSEKVINLEDWTLQILALSPDGDWLASGNNDGTISLWEVKTGTVVKSYTIHTDRITEIAFSPDGKIIASAGEDDVVRLWDRALEKEIQTIPFTIGVEIGGLIDTMAFSADQRLLAAGANDTVVRVWDVETGEKIAHLTGHINDVEGIAFSPDGTILASGSDGGIIKLWKMTDIENQ